MGKTVSISDYWMKWMEKILSSAIRKSRAEIVEEGLKAIKYTLDREFMELEEAKEIVKERHVE